MRSFIRRTAARRCQYAFSTKSVDGYINVEQLKNGIVHVELIRSDKLNALDMKMFKAISDTATSLAEDKSVRCVILSGKGKAFCSGLDVKSIFADPLNMPNLLKKPAGSPNSNIVQDVGYLWRNVKCPVIASLHGVCFGGGLQIALGADFRISTPDCKLSIMEAKWGLIPDMSISVTLRGSVDVIVCISSL